MPAITPDEIEVISLRVPSHEGQSRRRASQKAILNRDPRSVHDAGAKMMVTRLASRNYKSLAACDVALGPLTIVVGRNGAGKSSFLDTMRFTAEALQTSVDHALRARGGIAEVCHRGVAQRSHFGIRLDFRLADALGWYAFDIGVRDDGGYVVRREECLVRYNGDGVEQFFRIENGRCAATSLAYPPLADSAALYLVRASSAPEFRPVYGALANMLFYQIRPAQPWRLASSGRRSRVVT